jgi:hypothetical protein
MSLTEYGTDAVRGELQDGAGQTRSIEIAGRIEGKGIRADGCGGED